MSKIDYNRLTKDKSLNDVITINVSVTKIDENGGKEQLDVVWNNGKEVYTVYDFGETEVNIFGLLDLESQISGLKKSDTLVFDILPVFKAKVNLLKRKTLARQFIRYGMQSKSTVLKASVTLGMITTPVFNWSLSAHEDILNFIQ